MFHRHARLRPRGMAGASRTPSWRSRWTEAGITWNVSWPGKRAYTRLARGRRSTRLPATVSPTITATEAGGASAKPVPGSAGISMPSSTLSGRFSLDRRRIRASASFLRHDRTSGVMRRASSRSASRTNPPAERSVIRPPCKTYAHWSFPAARRGGPLDAASARRMRCCKTAGRRCARRGERVRSGYPRQPRSACSAAANPDRIAPSIVDGHPVATQSPARYRPRTGVVVCGRRFCDPGPGTKVARG